MTIALLQAQKTKLETALNAYIDAIIALGTNNVQSYELDTGQGRQRVTRADIADLHSTYDGLWSSYQWVCSQLGDSGITQIVPRW